MNTDDVMEFMLEEGDDHGLTEDTLQESFRKRKAWKRAEFFTLTTCYSPSWSGGPWIDPHKDLDSVQKLFERIANGSMGEPEDDYTLYVYDADFNRYKCKIETISLVPMRSRY